MGSSVVTMTNVKVKDDLDIFLGLPQSSVTGPHQLGRFFLPNLNDHPQHPQATDEEEAESSKPEVFGDTCVYPKGKLVMTLMTPSSYSANDPYYLIQDYVNFSQPSSFGVKILKVYQLSRSSEETQDWSDEKVGASISNRMMLWHGTRPDNVRSILEKGLLKPPTPNGSHLIGRGIYFADRIAKSSNYCSLKGPIEGEIGYLFLCEVQLGTIVPMHGHYHRIPPADGLPHSSKYLGGLVPDGKGNREVDGVTWPLGATVDGGNGLSRAYNEFIVHQEENIKLKYLVKVEFKKEPVFNHYIE